MLIAYVSNIMWGNSDLPVYLFPDLIKHVNAFINFLERPVYFCLKLSIRTHDRSVLKLRSLPIMRGHKKQGKTQS